MKARLSYLTLGLVIVFATIIICATDAEGQRRRRRPSRRVTNPVTVQRVEPAPSETMNPTDAQIVGTAEGQTSGDANATTQPRRQAETTRPETEQERLERTVNTLSTQVGQMSEEMRRMQQDQRTLVNLERLSRAEQRAENLRAQLREVAQQQFDLQSRADALDYELLPDSIERRLALTGARRPEEMREQIRRQLQNERDRVRAQLEMLNTNRTRLEAAIATADAETERVRALVNEPPPTTPADANSNQTAPARTTTEPNNTTPYPTTPPVRF
jgi:chromosome segregation ATPase